VREALGYIFRVPWDRSPPWASTRFMATAPLLLPTTILPRMCTRADIIAERARGRPDWGFTVMVFEGARET